MKDSKRLMSFLHNFSNFKLFIWALQHYNILRKTDEYLVYYEHIVINRVMI